MLKTRPAANNRGGKPKMVWLYADAFNVTGRVAVQALQVIVDDAGKVLTFRLTKQD